MVCIKDTVTKYNSKGDPYESKDSFLVIGKVYTSIWYGDNIVMFENESGDTWLSYDSVLFVSQDEWREMQLNGLGI